MGALDIGSIFPNGLNLTQALELLWPMVVVVLGMAAYAIFVFKFYRFVAARDMFGLNLSDRAAFGSMVRDVIFLAWYALRYLILFPAFAFFWFAVLTLILVFLSDSRELPEILLIAMATVSAIRVAAYYNEDLSRDLAKILPFAVLGVFIIDTSFFDVQSSLDTLGQINAHLDIIVYYLMFLIALEFGLRLIYVFLKLLFPGRRQPQADNRPAAPPAARPERPQQRNEPAGASTANGRNLTVEEVEAEQREPGAGQPAD